jgi:hypothetical protein
VALPDPRPALQEQFEELTAVAMRSRIELEPGRPEHLVAAEAILERLEGFGWQARALGDAALAAALELRLYMGLPRPVAMPPAQKGDASQ